MIRLPSRQVHLDFHTSEHIPDVGARFDKRQWQEGLQLGRLNSITVFAKCHHSWSYYPTEVGRPHPTLQCDLLGGQIEACHEIGVRAPIYYTIGWSANDAEDHPEWWARNRDGSPFVSNVAFPSVSSSQRRQWMIKLLLHSLRRYLPLNWMPINVP